MFRNRKQARERQRVARPSFRPQLECLEARTLLDASGSVTGAVATLGHDLSQAVSDAIHLQGAAFQRDAAKVVQDGINVMTQLNTPPSGGNLADDVIAMEYGQYSTQQGLAMAAFGVSVAADGAPEAGLPMAIGGVNMAENGAQVYTAGMEHGYEDLMSYFSGGQQQPQPGPTPTPTPNAPATVGTWTATLVPSQAVGNVNPNTSQTVTLTINADGSGSMSVAPFAGSGITVSFPAGTALLDDSSVIIDGYVSPTGMAVGATLGLNASGNILSGDFYAVNNNTDDAAYFDSAALNKQG